MNKKLLFVSYSYPPYRGGIARYVGNISKELSKKNNVIVLTMLGESYKDNNIKVIKYDIGSNFPIILRKTYFFINVLMFTFKNINKIDAIFVNSSSLFATITLIAKSIKREIKTFVFAHADEMIIKENFIKRKIKEIMLRNLTSIIAVVHFVENIIKENGIKTHTIVIPPIYKGKFYKKKHTNQKDKIILLTIAAMVRRKGIQLVIEAINSLEKEYKEKIKYIVGGRKTQYTNHLYKLIEEYNLQGIVEIKTDISEEKKEELYKISDIFIMPTFKDNEDIEGFGIVYQEASAHTLPIIASPVGGVVESVKDGLNGIMVKEKDINEIKEAIKKLVNDPSLRQKLGDNGFNMVKSEKRSDIDNILNL